MYKIIFFLILGFLFSCNFVDVSDFSESTKIFNNNNDTATKYIDFPICINKDSSEFVVFPIKYDQSRNKGYYSSYEYDYYYGEMNSNLIFYNLNNGDHYLIDENDVNIKSISFVYSQNLGLIFYTVASEDTNEDGFWTFQDDSQLAVSDNQGKNYRIITPTNFNLLSWNVFTKNNFVIVRMIEDTNKDGKYELKNDKIKIEKIDLKNFNQEEIFDKEFIEKATK
ncbi:MAG: hypothetical protein JXL97_18095 [Bacteroidales bacterium]|nr:hypothetical protein [Bacteroidales bacterium]